MTNVCLANGVYSLTNKADAEFETFVAERQFHEKICNDVLSEQNFCQLEFIDIDENRWHYELIESIIKPDMEKSDKYFLLISTSVNGGWTRVVFGYADAKKDEFECIEFNNSEEPESSSYFSREFKLKLGEFPENRKNMTYHSFSELTVDAPSHYLLLHDKKSTTRHAFYYENEEIGGNPCEMIPYLLKFIQENLLTGK